MVPWKKTMTNEKNNPDQDARGVEGLTEVLRLQAEALSRISERMSGARGASQESGPAKAPAPAQAQPAEPQGGAHLPALSRDPALNQDSLPVLNSFKKFLDDERRQSRRRILWMTLGLTVAFSGALAGIVWLNSESVNGVRSNIIQEREKSEKARQSAAAAIKRVETQAAQATAQTASTMRKDITRNILWAHSVISSNVNTELSGRDGEFDRLKEKISVLEVENTMLTRKLNELARRVKSVEDDYRDFLERPILESQLSEQDAEDAAGAAAVTNVTAELVPRAAPLTINSGHFGRRLRLQVPKDK